MPGRRWLFALFVVCAAGGAANAQAPGRYLGAPRPAPERVIVTGPVLFTALEQPPGNGGEPNSKEGEEKSKEKENGKGKEKENGKEKEKKNKQPKEPEHIRDNAFFVEEAFNQERGEVQHVFNWINFWDRANGTRTRDFNFTYTMELPLGGQKHQFSFTTQMLTAYERPPGGPPEQTGDVGDTFVNYRYQLLADDDFLWCAPRFTLILPTGDPRLGTGTGEVGYQFNLPVSIYGEDFDYHFNAGATYTPNVRRPTAPGVTSPEQDLSGYNLGASAFYKPETFLNFFVEFVVFWNQEIDESGGRDSLVQVLVNPGFRYAICQLEEVEWVIGVGVPVGLSRDAPDIGVFAYMSVEHGFRQKPEECEEEEE